MEHKRGFSSRIGFMMSMAAFSVGIGNMWKFPYVVGNSGGGAFLIVYIIMALIIGLPCFMIELVLGRSSRHASPILAMRKLTGKKKTPWGIIGVLGIVAIFCIDSFAITIVGGWTGGYTVKTAMGFMYGQDAAGIGAIFGQFSGSKISLIGNLVCAVLLWLCVSSGVKKGVERVCKVLLPALLVIMIALSIYTNTLSGAHEGLMWYLKPDFSAINLSVISAAGMQVCFSIGIGMLCAFVYGSYMTDNTALPGAAMTTVILDTIIAILSGLLIVPALFAFGIEPASGPSLIFITLPQLFGAMGGAGRIFGTLFMLCVFFAGFTSILGGTESLTATLEDHTKMSRKKCATIIVVLQFLVSILVTFSFSNGIMGSLRILKLGFFDFLDFLSSGICLPVGALLMLLFVIFGWKFDKFKHEVNLGTKESSIKLKGGFMKFYFYVILLVLLAFVCYTIFHTYFGMIAAA